MDTSLWFPAAQTVLIGPDGHVAGLGPTPQKESEMTEAKLSWFDRLLIKIAVAKAASRGKNADNVAESVLSAFGRINEASSRTSQSGDRAERQ
ncbi:hypothetical protein [Thauera aromatica]|uniref:hypothetical protein n=1 Tax=Thauera aromatica TaxID=59405 RepID=UPI001FFC5B64|nr:hypothetical protein [Thauera aromatica]MCK2097540.1 hypothetical protein [Thauera aromatica]